MTRVCLCFLMGCLFVMSGGLAGQEKKDDPKKKDEPTKKDDPPVKAKGVLPMNWKKIGLTDEQVQKIYRIQTKYNDEIAALEAKIAELKTTKDKEMKGVLTADQKKRLEDILLGKDK